MAERTDSSQTSPAARSNRTTTGPEVRPAADRPRPAADRLRSGALTSRGAALGKVVAISVALIFIGIVGLVAVMYRGAQSGGRFGDAGKGPRETVAGQSGAAGPLPANPAPPQDITQTGLAGLGRARVQYVDRTDSSKAIGLIEWSQIDPLPGGRSAVKQPRATLFVSPTARIVITAERGTLVSRPPAIEPESGLFEGDVTAKFISAGGAGGGGRAESELMSFRTGSIAFDLALGEASTPGEFEILGSGVAASGKGLRIVANQASRKLELLRINSVSVLTINPDQLRELGSTMRRETASAGAATPVTAAPAAPVAPVTSAELVRSIYQLTLGPDVVIRQADVQVEAPQVRAVATMLGDKIAPDAIAALPIFARQLSAPASSEAPAGGGAGATGPAPTVRTSEAKPGRDSTVHVSFTGPLEVRPIGEMPQALQGQLAGVILGAGAVPGGQVSARLRSASDRSTAFRAAGMVYGATKPTVTMTSAGPEAQVEITDAGSGAGGGGGMIQAAGLRATLADGVLSFIGPGVAAAPAGELASRDGPAQGRSLRWSDQLDVTLKHKPGMLTDQPTLVVISGDAVVEDRAGTATAGVLRLNFADDSGGVSRLNRVELRENAALRAAVASEGTLGADEVDLELGTRLGGRDPELRGVLARRGVYAERRGAKLTASELDAKLESDEQGKPTLVSVFAKGPVSFSDDRGTFAKADTMRADGQGQVVDLAGTAVSIGRGNVQLFGTQMRLDGLKRDLFIHGPGRLLAISAKGDSSLEMVWNEYLRFEDEKGTAECRGRTVATSRRDRLQVDTLRAEAMRAAFEPEGAAASEGGGSGGGGGGGSGAGTGAAFGAGGPASGGATNRRIVRVEAIGESAGALPVAIGNPAQAALPRATVESRRYAAAEGTAEGKLEQLLYMEGDRIIASPSQLTLDVPGPGKLLVDDLRDGVGAVGVGTVGVGAIGGGAQDGAINTAKPGTSLFSWLGSLHVNQEATVAGAKLPNGQMAKLPNEEAGKQRGLDAGEKALAGSRAEMVMREGVRLLHCARGTDVPLSLRADQLGAVLRSTTARAGAGAAGAGAAGAGGGADGSPLAGSAGGELVSANASGNVELLTPEGRRLTAGGLEFDAGQRIVTAVGDAPSMPVDPDIPGRVTVSDPSRPTPLVAKRLRFWVSTGRAEILEPMPIVGPGKK